MQKNWKKVSFELFNISNRILGLHFEEQKDLKDRAKVLRQRRQEMKNFHKKNVSFDD